MFNSDGERVREDILFLKHWLFISMLLNFYIFVSSPNFFPLNVLRLGLYF